MAKSSPEEFKASFLRNLKSQAKEQNLSIEAPTIEEGISDLILKLFKEQGRVVILIDEYDHPIINNLHRIEFARANQETLKSFFETLKNFDKYLRFTFITGVSKFAQVSIFSGLNNLSDITMEADYAAITGYTEEEIENNFENHIMALIDKRGEKGSVVTTKDVIDEIRTWYNGYRFSESYLSVYNPYSTLFFLDKGKPKNYWYKTGTPSFLIKKIKKHPKSAISLIEKPVLESTLSDINKLDKIPLIALMFQTGYLTIKSYNSEEDSYSLDFPNREVKEAFFKSLLEDFAEVDPLEVIRSAESLREHLYHIDISSFIKAMNRHFAKIPHHLFKEAKESFYHAVFFTFLESSGIRTIAELATSLGRIDLVAECKEIVYVFELKWNKTAKTALTQAEIKSYKERFSQGEKQIVVLGINFSSETRNIDDWKGILYSGAGALLKEILP